MPDRLEELLRQKALLDEHAAWLEREIARERARSGAAPPPATPAPSAPPSSASTAGEADAVLEQYRTSPQSIHQQVRRGCLLYFIGAMALVGLGVLAVYFLGHRR